MRIESLQSSRRNTLIGGEENGGRDDRAARSGRYMSGRTRTKVLGGEVAYKNQERGK